MVRGEKLASLRRSAVPIVDGRPRLGWIGGAFAAPPSPIHSRRGPSSTIGPALTIVAPPPSLKPCDFFVRKNRSSLCLHKQKLPFGVLAFWRFGVSPQKCRIVRAEKDRPFQPSHLPVNPLERGTRSGRRRRLRAPKGARCAQPTRRARRERR
jgi:hypothetical protein